MAENLNGGISGPQKIWFRIGPSRLADPKTLFTFEVLKSGWIKFVLDPSSSGSLHVNEISLIVTKG
jgi:hypothetical protein